MSFWKSLPSPVWATIWLIIFPPVNLVNLFRLIAYRQSGGKTGEEYRSLWIIIILSLISILLLPPLLLLFYLLLKSSLMSEQAKSYLFWE